MIEALVGSDYFVLLMFPGVLLAIFMGFPVSFSLMGMSLIFRLFRIWRCRRRHARSPGMGYRQQLRPGSSPAFCFYGLHAGSVRDRLAAF